MGFLPRLLWRSDRGALRRLSPRWPSSARTRRSVPAGTMRPTWATSRRHRATSARPAASSSRLKRQRRYGPPRLSACGACSEGRTSVTATASPPGGAQWWHRVSTFLAAYHRRLEHCSERPRGAAQLADAFNSVARRIGQHPVMRAVLSLRHDSLRSARGDYHATVEADAERQAERCQYQWGEPCSFGSAALSLLRPACGSHFFRSLPASRLLALEAETCEGGAGLAL